MKKLLAISCGIFILLQSSQSQTNTSTIEGVVFELGENGTRTVLPGANVYWLETGEGEITDEEGKFSISRNTDENQLITSYVGYSSDTILIGNQPEFLEIQMSSSVKLDEVQVVHRQKSSSISYVEPIKVEKITEKEFLKAACCNLSESFETTPSVDVNFTDAITGTRQIQMLGLAGPYTQIMRENMPDVRGLSSLYGLVMIPGTWVEGLQLSKGTGSVVNGFESIAGQINIELREPFEGDRFYLNGYFGSAGRIEANAHGRVQLSEKLSTNLLLHTMQKQQRMDPNEDGFLDDPLNEHYIAMNRWDFRTETGWEGQLAVKGTLIDNTGGQHHYHADEDAGSTTIWGLQQKLRRWEGFAKLGHVSEIFPWRSFGIQLSAARHTQESFFGTRPYDAAQTNLYANFIYQSILSNTLHGIKFGASLLHDDYEEAFSGQDFDRVETVPGIFGEYSYLPDENFTLVAGLRLDHHNHYGLFITPRVHARYALTENTVMRGSVGRGFRSAALLAENQGLMASSREFIFEGDGSDKPYGLNPEIAWNFGLNLTQSFNVMTRPGTITFDFYHTIFDNQIVIDLEQSPQEVHFYNLRGKSFSNSFQAQMDYELLKRLDLRLAYRFFDVQTTYGEELLERPLTGKHRAFGNLAYSTPNGWSFDFTANWQGEKRIPNTASNPAEYRREVFSEDYFIFNSQVSKRWGEKFEIYSGVENIFSYTQDDPIIASDDPFGDYFDASMIWAPVFGRNIYVGFRYKIQ